MIAPVRPIPEGSKESQLVSVYTAEGDGETSDEGGSDLPRLTPAEDAEMRQLAWFAKAGHLSDKSQARLSELRARDRRKAIRDPRPDPSSGGGGAATRFRSEESERSACPNCGFGRSAAAGPSGSCSNCGYSARADDEARPARSVTSVVELDKAAFFNLLLNAARGGSPPDAES